jgi:hypothetical protein
MNAGDIAMQSHHFVRRTRDRVSIPGPPLGAVYDRALPTDIDVIGCKKAVKIFRISACRRDFPSVPFLFD